MAESSIGVKVQYSTDDVSYTTAGCLTEVNFGGMTKDTFETQCLSQDTSRWKTFAGKFADPGEATFTLDWDPEDYTAMVGMIDDEFPIYWRIVVPDGSDITDPTTCSRLKFQGLVTNLGLSFEADGGRVTAPVTVKFSGAPTFAEAP